ncbi:MAG: nucleotidyltransferase domain-containing protein [Candidatus Bathyarchaeia archaeon]
MLVEKERVKLAIVFGSLTTREYIRDIDVCIISDPKLNLRELLDLNAEMELEAGVPVDLVEMENLPETLKANIARNGVIIKGSRRLLDKIFSNNP